MEDIKKLYGNMCVPWDNYTHSTDIDELMRRAPGLSPEEEIDFAYLVVNNGIDVFYEKEDCSQ